MIDREAFVNALVSQLPHLRRYAVAITGNAALADDLVQDSIERALRQSAQLRELELLPRWLRRILHNLYVDEIRRRQSRGSLQDIMELSDHLELSTPALDGNLAREFVKAMDALSIEHRQILLLVGLEELSYRQIADELEVPIGTVMSRLARARERLRSIMEDGTDSNVVLAPLVVNDES